MLTVSQALNLDLDRKFLQYLIQCALQGTMELIIATNILLLSQFEYTTKYTIQWIHNKLLFFTLIHFTMVLCDVKMFVKR